jgi:3-oxoacyl-[acyl-carrier-protein] synthase II
VLLGEGSAYLVLEELSHALNRGARIYAEILGHGRSCEAYHPVAPHPDGIGYFRAIQKAMRQAQIDADQVDYINAHGTATEANDVIETKAIKRFFESHAYRLAISSTKPVTGHLLGAAGALEAVITVLALQRGELPPSMFCDPPDPQCAVRLVRQPGTSAPGLQAAISSSFAFGGTNVVLAFRRV